METECLLQCSQNPAIFPYIKPNEFSSQPPASFFKMQINIIFLPNPNPFLLYRTVPFMRKQWSLSQQFPRLLWYPKTHYNVHKILPFFHVLSQINPVHTPSMFP
jgi:hypothetical protein